MQACFSIAGTSARSKFFSCTPAGLSGQRKIAGPGPSPKGEYSEGEDPLAAARREFKEETGLAVEGNFIELGTIRQAGGKLVSAWAIEGDFDPGKLVSNRFELQWPPHSGRMIEVPEVDRGAWFCLPEAKERILPSQSPILDRLAEKLDRQS